MSAARSGVAARRVAVEIASLRARSAVIAVLVAAGAGAISDAGVAGWLLGIGPHSEAFERLAGIVAASSHFVWLVAGVLFLMWVHRAVSNAPLLGVPMEWGPRQAVVAHLIPVVSLILPYYVMRALYRGSDPSPLGDAPVFRERAEATYRGGARELVAPPRWILPAPLLAWWILFDTRMTSGIFFRGLGGGLVGQGIAASCELAAGVLCVLVVRSIDARQRERCRRLEAAGASEVSP